VAEQASLWEQADLLAGAAASGMAVAEAAMPHRAAEQATIPPRRPRRPQPEPAAPALSLPALAPPARGVSRAAAPERIRILDAETTALSPEQGHCIEVGAVLFHVPTRAVLQQISFLLPAAENPAQAINGIPAAVTRLSQPRDEAIALFLAMAASAEVAVAHNAAFDRQWFGHGALPDLNLPWICSMEEMRWPAERHLKATPSVRDLALAYGVPVWAAHRALSDCHYLVHVFKRCSELEGLLLAAREPRQLYVARLSYAERHHAREAGFRWNDPVPGAWSRRLTAREAADLAFPVAAVESDRSTPLPRSA